MILRLAFVDVQGPQDDEFRPLVEQLAANRNLLLVVCGNDGDASQETWARGLGAWLYLPAVREDGCVRALCFEARKIAERMQPVVPPKNHLPV